MTMDIFWSLGKEPTLRSLAGPERRAALREATRIHVGELGSLLYALPGGIGAGVGVLIGNAWTHGPWVPAILAGVGAWLGSVIAQSLLIRRVAPHLPDVVEARRRRRIEG